MNQQNSGKASILCEATKFLKDVFGQIESLRKEQTALLSESNYVRHFPLKHHVLLFLETMFVSMV